jgi:hypothetical protein
MKEISNSDSEKDVAPALTGSLLHIPGITYREMSHAG